MPNSFLSIVQKQFNGGETAFPTDGAGASDKENFNLNIISYTKLAQNDHTFKCKT